MRAIDRVHNPTPDLRTLKVGNRDRGREKLRAIDDLHDTVVTRAVCKVDSITRGPSGDGTMDGRYRIESVWSVVRRDDGVDANSAIAKHSINTER